MSIDCMNPWPSIVDHRALRRGLGVLAEQHDLAHDHLGRVVADVGELLGAHVADVAAQRRQHEREPLGDATRVDAGAVQRDAARHGTRLRSRRRPACRPDRSSRPASRRSCPTRATRSRRACSRAPASTRPRRRRSRRSRRACRPRSRRSGRCQQISPTSRPTLSALCTHAPTSSSSGWASTPGPLPGRRVRLPTGSRDRSRVTRFALMARRRSPALRVSIRRLRTVRVARSSHQAPSLGTT